MIHADVTGSNLAVRERNVVFVLVHFSREAFRLRMRVGSEQQAGCGEEIRDGPVKFHVSGRLAAAEGLRKIPCRHDITRHDGWQHPRRHRAAKSCIVIQAYN